MTWRIRMPQDEPYRLMEMIGEAEPTMTSPMTHRAASNADRHVVVGRREGRGVGMARRAIGRSDDRARVVGVPRVAGRPEVDRCWRGAVEFLGSAISLPLLVAITRPDVHDTSLSHPSFSVVEPQAGGGTGLVLLTGSFWGAHHTTLATERKSP
jgi:hypothetical protein